MPPEDDPTPTIMSVDEARRITDEIKSCIVDLAAKIIAAYEGQAWRALGYHSWDEYTRTEIRSTLTGIPREDRDTMIASLRWAGLSQRSIAAATGSSRDTVRNLTHRQVGPAGPPAQSHDGDTQDRHPGSTRVIGADGRRYPAAPSRPERAARRRPPPDWAAIGSRRGDPAERAPSLLEEAHRIMAEAAALVGAATVGEGRRVGASRRARLLAQVDEIEDDVVELREILS